MLLGVSGISIIIAVSFSGLFLKKLVQVFDWLNYEEFVIDNLCIIGD